MSKEVNQVEVLVILAKDKATHMYNNDTFSTNNTLFYQKYLSCSIEVEF